VIGYSPPLVRPSNDSSLGAPGARLGAHGLSTGATVAVAVGVAVGGLLLLAAAGLLAVRALRAGARGQRTLLGGVVAPGAGLKTTLLVTGERAGAAPGGGSCPGRLEGGSPSCPQLEGGHALCAGRRLPGYRL
jgi:hypothetical protein